MRYFRPNIEEMEGYVPGKQPRTAGYIKLNTNENPYPPSPRVLAAIRDCATDALRLYPDPLATEVREKASEVYGVPPDCIICGNGGDELLTMIFRAFVGEGDRVLLPYPTYVLYETLTKIQDGKVIYRDFNPDYSLPEDFFDIPAKLVIISNPNSPSGTVLDEEVLRRLAGSVKGILLIDEAYVDFAERDCLRLSMEFENVIVLRSFSKSFSLAGVRIGLAFANEEIIGGLRKVKDSYNVSRIWIAAARAALEDIAYMRENAERIKENRRYLTEKLQALGAHVFPSQSNFVLARFEEPVSAKALYEELERRKILVRYFEMRRLEDCLRITVGTREEIDALISAMEEITEALKA